MIQLCEFGVQESAGMLTCVRALVKLVQLVEDDEDGMEVTGYPLLLGGLCGKFGEEVLKGLWISRRILCEDDAAD